MTEYHPYRRAHPHSRLLTIEAVVFLAFVVFLFLLSGASTNASPGAVLLGFLPSLIFGIVVIVLVETDHFYPTYNWLVLVMILVIASILYFLAPTPAIAGLDAGTVLVLNGLIMIVALFIMQNSYAHERPMHEHEIQEHHRKKHEEEARKQTEHVSHTVHHVHHVGQPTEISDIIHSVEDKIKALNFVIGRVYSVYHGGTERLRNKIRIDKAWYNDFNEIPESSLEKRRHEAIVLVQKIKERLELLKKSELDLFGDDVAALRNIAHDPTGKDAVITVLVRNDKDPVQQYYDGALSFCEDALTSLRADGTKTSANERSPIEHGPKSSFVPKGAKFSSTKEHDTDEPERY